MNREAERDIRRKMRILEYGKQSGNVSFTCRKFDVSRDSYYRWKRQLEQYGELDNSRWQPNFSGGVR